MFGRRSSTDTEASLLARAQKGDFEAFAALCEPLRAPVCVYLVQSNLATEDNAEDIFCDALLRARTALRSFRGGSSFRTWLFTIARNRALDLKRANAAHAFTSLDATLSTDSENGRARELLRSEVDPTVPMPGESPAPDEALARTQTARLVREALEQLPEATRSALVLVYFHDFSYAEAAQALSVPIGTIMSRLHNGRKKLAALLADLREDLLP